MLDNGEKRAGRRKHEYSSAGRHAGRQCDRRQQMNNKKKKNYKTVIEECKYFHQYAADHSLYAKGEKC